MTTEDAQMVPAPLGPVERGVGRLRPKRVLIDHRLCGGGGCATCHERGTELVAVMRPAGGPMPRDEAAFEAAREECPCYAGYSINAGVSQCTHADRRDDGEWCEPGACPLVARHDPPNVAIKPRRQASA